LSAPTVPARPPVANSMTNPSAVTAALRAFSSISHVAQRDAGMVAWMF
jgi:hypothetical protein